MDSGIYCLILYLGKEITLTIGKLGYFLFPKGHYVYTGRALKGLSSRIKRHLNRKKNLSWHIDYLLQSEWIKVLDILTYSVESHTECEINKRVRNIEGATIVAQGFGSSDCKAKCISHLIYFPCSVSVERVRTPTQPSPLRGGREGVLRSRTTDTDTINKLLLQKIFKCFHGQFQVVIEG